MPTMRHPRHGSLQYWPRKRAARTYSRIRNHIIPEENVLSGFAGYKVCMTQVQIADNRPNSMTKGETITLPVTVVECPPVKVHSIRLYTNSDKGLKFFKEISGKETGKDLARKLKLQKKEKKVDEDINLSNVIDVRVNIYTQPGLSGVGKKKPEIFEVAVGGKDIEDRFKFAKEILGKEISVKDVLKEGQQVDVFAVTTGKGFQGPVKRFGVSLRSHKSEKVIRGPGNLGSWGSPRTWTVAHAGQTGFHNRLERNKWVLKISDKPKEFDMSGGIIHYGKIKTHYMIINGSLQGHSKRLLRLIPSRRPNTSLPNEAPTIENVSLTSKQGR
jgi:large subunit ribosomal protein L3